jgi:hypothetical protein
MGIFGKRRAAAESSAVVDSSVPPARHRPEDNTVVLMRGVEGELADVAAEARSAVEAFLTSLRADCRPEGRISLQSSDVIEQYQIGVAGYQITWSMGPSIHGKVLVQRIVALS